MPGLPGPNRDKVEGKYYGTPIVISEEVPFDKHDGGVEELNIMRPMGGHFWWNSLYWTNFPPLYCLQGDDDHPTKHCVSTLNSDSKLSEQYVSFGAAREDLCKSRGLPTVSFNITVECMQYEGVRDVAWQFPLIGYIPKRDNHQPNDIQARRFYDNGVLTMGLNAEEFSAKVTPVGNLDACITWSDYCGNPTWGYYFCLMRIGGWPFRVKKMGTFEGEGEGGHKELHLGIHHSEDEKLWNFLEGEPEMAPTGPNGEMEIMGNAKVGQKFWCQLMDLDWLGPKIDDRRTYDPEVPPEKAYVWFKVVDTVTVPSTGAKGIKIQLLDEGVVPAWLDLVYMQVFAGDLPLGYFNQAVSEEDAARGEVTVSRVVDSRKVTIKNKYSKMVFDDPKPMKINDFVDMGWAIADCLFKGAVMKLGPRPGILVDAGEIGMDEGIVNYKCSGPPALTHGMGPDAHTYAAPQSDYPCERRLCV
mmetsp:Transcript_103821/g.231955  ORF Transcript_103821/g.231955 Transcript_103821/m.231955 type:complete len:471 (-) Transcript_103821:135-1547(-)